MDKALEENILSRSHMSSFLGCSLFSQLSAMVWRKRGVGMDNGPDKRTTV